MPYEKQPLAPQTPPDQTSPEVHPGIIPTNEGGERPNPDAESIQISQPGIPDAVSTDNHGEPVAHIAAPRWSSETSDTTTLEPSRKGRLVLKITAGVAALGTIVGVIVAATSGNDKPEGKGATNPSATSTPTAGEQSISATTSQTPEQSPSGLPSVSKSEQAHTGLDITDLTSLPSDVVTEVVHIRNWEVPLPASLVDPAKDPELFTKEVLLVVAAADSVPVDSALFGQCLDLLGHSDHTDRFSVDLKAQNQHIKDLTSPYSDTPPQLIFFNNEPLTVSYDEAQGTTSLATADGKSIWFAADAFPTDQWQDSAAKVPGEDQHVFPNGQLEQYVISSFKSSLGNIVVSKIDTGASETFK